MTFIMAQELHKTYQTKTGPVHALGGLSLSVEQGTVRGLLGPSGAGKTTFMRVLTALLRLGSGRTSAAGIGVLVGPAKVRPPIDTSDQYAVVDEMLTTRENLVLVGRLYRIGTCQAKRHAEKLLETFDLIEAANRSLKGSSGGMWKRVGLAGTLVIDPPVLFLDKSTTDLDSQARMGFQEVIRERAGERITALLTTQYLEGADQLADSTSVIDRGHVIAEGVANEFKMSVDGRRIELTLVGKVDTDRAWRIVVSNTGTEVAVTGRVLTTQVSDLTAALIVVLKVLDEGGVGLHDASIRRPTPNDIFLILTGHAAEEQETVA